MKSTFKILTSIFIALCCIFILWISGVLASLPLIPWVETDYLVDLNDQNISEGVTLKKVGDVIIQLEVADGFSEDNQCFDVWFISSSGKQALTVTDFSLTAHEDDTEIKKASSYLFWDDGSEDEAFTIKDYEIENSRDYENGRYVFFRSVFDVDQADNITMAIKSSFTIDGQEGELDAKLNIKKKHRLTWNELRAH